MTNQIKLEDISPDVREMHESRIQRQLESAGNPKIVTQCIECRKVRFSKEEGAYWFRAITREYEAVLNSKVDVSHGYCPPCEKSINEKMNAEDAAGII